MPDRLIREPDERSGPAALGREPVILPDKRKRMKRKLQRKLNEIN